MQRIQCHAEVRRTLPTIALVFRKGPHHRSRESFGDLRIDNVWRRRIVLQMIGDDLSVVGAFYRQPSSDHFVKRNSHRIQVRAGVCWFA